MYYFIPDDLNFSGHMISSRRCPLLDVRRFGEGGKFSANFFPDHTMKTFNVYDKTGQFRLDVNPDMLLTDRRYKIRVFWCTL